MEDNGPFQQSQGRIYLDYDSAWRVRRSFGYIANMRFEKEGGGFGQTSFFFRRDQAYLGGSELRGNKNMFLHARPLTPVVFHHVKFNRCRSLIFNSAIVFREFWRPRDRRNCRPTLFHGKFWILMRSIKSMVRRFPIWRQRCYEPKTVADLPQLGGVNFWPAPTLSTLNAMRLELPPQDIFHFR